MSKLIVIIIFLLIVFLPDYLIATPKDRISIYDIGLSLKEDQIDYSRMTASQKDTITFGLFNPEDYYLDVAVYHPSRREIAIYKNIGGGFLTEYNILPQTKDVRKIEAANQTGISLHSDLKITYKDGTQQVVYNKVLNSVPGKSEPKVPLWNWFDEPKAFLYDISFVEQWRSQRNGEPQDRTAVGDIDRDGKNEAVYTFYPRYQWYPAHIVIFENVSQNQYRIDWDTTLDYNGVTNYTPVTDFDHDSNREFFVRAKNWNGTVGIMICECEGEGKYRFKFCGLGGFANTYDIQVKDSAIVVNGEPKAEVWLCEAFAPTYQQAYIERYRFNVKTQGNYSFPLIFETTVNNFVYSISVGDIDEDSRDEAILGTASGFGTGYFAYLDSTGISSNSGYEKKTVYLSEPLCIGYGFTKDFDGDGYKEAVLCGFGYGGGSIGIIKHSGNPGQNQFNVMWWDTAGIVYAPNMGVDTGYIDSQYTILYPTVKYSGNMDYLNIITYTRNSTFSFYKSCLQVIDSAALTYPRLFDIDDDGKMNIVSSMFIQNLQYPENYSGTQLVDFEQVGVIGVEPISSEIPIVFMLEQNYPNPFNPKTKIKFGVPLNKGGLRGLSVKLVIYDVLGREIASLANEELKPGSYIVEWDASNFSSGVYLYSLKYDGGTITKKLVLIK